MLLEGRNIAVIEDDPIMSESLLQSLSLEGAKVSLYASGQAALKCVVPRSVDLVVCDIRLPDTDGQSPFRRFGADANAPPFLFMTAFGDVDAAVELMRQGAADYLTKPSKIDSPVLITGETGTGKDVCARFLHQIAEMRGPFMAVNCAAIPGELLESELFGHEAGAFTGAAKRHLGFAERAGEGTLFLDEIGELALPLQAKLLQLLEHRQFYRVGGEIPVAFKGRLVTATNADLNTLIAAKQFRLDLYYRINVVEVKIPPLRERPQDIAWLMNQIFADIVAEQRKSMRGVSAPAEQAALTHPWPGNVRELKNRLERAIALNLSGWISPQDLFPEKHLSAAPALHTSCSLADAREAAEKHQIALALTDNDGQIGKTAETLGISRTTLWEKMKRYGLAES